MLLKILLTFLGASWASTVLVRFLLGRAGSAAGGGANVALTGVGGSPSLSAIGFAVFWILAVSKYKRSSAVGFVDAELALVFPLFPSGIGIAAVVAGSLPPLNCHARILSAVNYLRSCSVFLLTFCVVLVLLILTLFFSGVLSGIGMTAAFAASFPPSNSSAVNYF